MILAAMLIIAVGLSLLSTEMTQRKFQNVQTSVSRDSDAVQAYYREGLVSLAQSLYDAGYGFYYALRLENAGVNFSAEDLFTGNVDDETVTGYIDQDEFDYQISWDYNFLLDTLSSHDIHYLAVSDSEELSDVSGVTAKNIENKLSEHGFYLCAKFDENGIMTISKKDPHYSGSLKNDVSEMDSEIRNIILSISGSDGPVMSEMTIYLFSDSDAYYQDLYRSYEYSRTVAGVHEAYRQCYIYPGCVLAILTAAAAWILLAAKKCNLRNSILMRLPLLASIVLFAAGALFYRHYAINMIWNFSSDYESMNQFLRNWLAGALIMLPMEILTFAAALSVGNAAILGPKRYINERMVSVRVFRWLSIRIKKAAELVRAEVRAAMTSGHYYRCMLLLLVLSFLFMVIFGGLIVFIYAWFGLSVEFLVLSEFVLVLLYHFLWYVPAKRYSKRLAGQYTNLKDTVEAMAQGNLNVEINAKDAGIFEPVVQNLVQVRDGMKIAVDRAVASQKMKTELITNVSHDLKTPLTAIITYVNLLKEENVTPEDQKKYIEVLDTKSARLKKLIEDLFEVSKADSGNVKVELADIDVGDLIRQAAFEYEEKLEAGNIQLRLQLPEGKVTWRLDGQKMYRIFDNLIGNIVKYSVPGTRAYLSAEVKEETLWITAKNISAQELPENVASLMDRFVRGEDSRHTEGSGLGLAIVQSFAGLQGGTFDISVDGDLFKAVLCFARQG